MARRLRAGVVAFDIFAQDFGDSQDELIAELYDLIEHEPQRGGRMGVSDEVYESYLRDIDRAISRLEEAQ